ncbi:hypothetical protein J4526_07105 [Desulfurococcaceae archaeon MEX13E-LK6-19]|nr:hypothetical protein J4526_07105 [Desulfurococcaceae archaeon MEX13E-LK6-19]
MNKPPTGGTSTITGSVIQELYALPKELRSTYTRFLIIFYILLRFGVAFFDSILSAFYGYLYMHGKIAADEFAARIYELCLMETVTDSFTMLFLNIAIIFVLGGVTGSIIIMHRDLKAFNRNNVDNIVSRENTLYNIVVALLVVYFIILGVRVVYMYLLFGAGYIFTQLFYYRDHYLVNEKDIMNALELVSLAETNMFNNDLTYRLIVFSLLLTQILICLTVYYSAKLATKVLEINSYKYAVIAWSGALIIKKIVMIRLSIILSLKLVFAAAFLILFVLSILFMRRFSYRLEELLSKIIR